jgi:hypothetical protein
MTITKFKTKVILGNTETMKTTDLRMKIIKSIAEAIDQKMIMRM